MATRSCNSTTARRSASPSSLVVRLEETGELLEQTCGEISDATTTELIEVANSVAAQRKMQDLLPVYFHSWQLQSPESIMVFLLLSYFVLKRECTGLKRDDHIGRLKTRVGELEQELEGMPQVPSATTDAPCSLIPVHNAELPLHFQATPVTVRAQQVDSCCAVSRRLIGGRVVEGFLPCPLHQVSTPNDYQPTENLATIGRAYL